MPKTAENILSSRQASPRCVMEQHASSPLSSSPSDDRRLSPIALQERYDRYMTRRAKLFVVQSKFKEALSVGNEFIKEHLHDGWSGPLSYFQTTMKLCTPLQIPPAVVQSGTRKYTSFPKTIFFQIRLGTQLTAVDEMATVVLQSWYELMKQDSRGPLTAEAWMHLQPILEIYAIHPMPIQLFTQIWIPFWHDSFHDFGPRLALAWGVQAAVLLVEHSSRIGATPVLVKECRDELLEFLITNQLPKLSSCTLAKQMALAMLTRDTWEPLVLQIDDHLQSHDQMASLRVLRSLLREQMMSDVCMVPSSLLKRILQKECFQNLPAVPLQAPLAVVPRNGASQLATVQIPKAFQDRLQAILPTSAKLLLSRLRQCASSLWSMAGLEDSTNLQALQQRKVQVAISIVTLLLAWRQRGLVRRWGKALSMLLLSPITELVEALRMSDSYES